MGKTPMRLSRKERADIRKGECYKNITLILMYAYNYPA